MSALEQAIELAVERYRGETRRDGQLKILHALRVMARMDTDHERIVAVLHDLVRRDKVSTSELDALAFDQDTQEALRAFSGNDGFDQLVQCAAENIVARKVLLASFEDRIDLRRQAKLKKKDVKRMARWRKAWEVLVGWEAAETKAEAARRWEERMEDYRDDPERGQGGAFYWPDLEEQARKRQEVEAGSKQAPPGYTTGVELEEDPEGVLVVISLMDDEPVMKQLCGAIRDDVPTIRGTNTCFTEWDTYPGKRELHLRIRRDRVREVLEKIRDRLGDQYCDEVLDRIDREDFANLWGTVSSNGGG